MEVIILQDLYNLTSRVGSMARCSGMFLKYLAKAGIKIVLAGNRDTKNYYRVNYGFFSPGPEVSKEIHTGCNYIPKLAIQTRVLDIPGPAIIQCQPHSFMPPFQ